MPTGKPKHKHPDLYSGSKSVVPASVDARDAIEAQFIKLALKIGTVRAAEVLRELEGGS